MNEDLFTAPRRQLAQRRYQLGDGVRILDPVRLAARLKTWPVYGVHGIVPRPLLDMPARIESLGETGLRVLIGWAGHGALWLDRDEVQLDPEVEIR